MKNPPVTELRQTLDLMSKAWQRLTQRKVIRQSLQGYIKRLEITRQLNGSDNAHPHYHCILMVKPSYFGAGYIKQKDWIKLWKESLKVDYDPSVDVKVIKPNFNKLKGSTIENAEARAIYHSLMEVVKYPVPPECLIWDYEPHNQVMRERNVKWLDELWHQLQGVRFISTGGVIREYVNEEEMQQLTDEDLIHYAEEAGVDINEYQSSEEAEEIDQLIWFSWHDRVNRYRLHQQQQEVS